MAVKTLGLRAFPVQFKLLMVYIRRLVSRNGRFPATRVRHNALTPATDGPGSP